MLPKKNDVQPIFTQAQTNNYTNLVTRFMPYLLYLFNLKTMITNFERETHELNHYELHTLLPIVVRGLSTKLGKSKAITNKDICKALKVGGCKITDTRLRKIVHHIRTNHLVPLLIATSKGYYIATNKDEVENYILSLSERINSISSVKSALIKQLSNVKDSVVY